MKVDFKVLLVAINTKYYHTNLAIRYLKKMAESVNIQAKILETTINNQVEEIIQKIYGENPTLLGFSCYIWNIEIVLKVARSIKELLPQVKILLGGPEVSFEEKEFFLEHPYVDYIIKGEGELPFKKLLQGLTTNDRLDNIPGLLTETFDNGMSLTLDLNEIPFPYEGEDLENIKGQIIYYEGSRGCPFNCSYCLSSTTKGVRFLDTQRIKKEIKILAEYSKMIKFVDRTFNCNSELTVDLLQFIKGLDTNTTFHLEVSAHLITEEILAIFKEMPINRVQLEIGVQTTNTQSIAAIGRKTNFQRLREVVKKINTFNNIHQHLDLIAGLPYEDYKSFAKSFNDVMELEPHKLQLGFLKLLKGSKIRGEKELHGYKFNYFPPYEVLENRYISFTELTKLKHIEHLLEIYYNSHKFQKSMEWLHTEFSDYFQVYEALYHYFAQEGLLDKNIGHNELYEILYRFYKTYGHKEELFIELLKFDYLSHKRTHTLPQFFGERENTKEKVFDFLKSKENIVKYLPNFQELRPTEIYKQIIVEKFNYNPLDKSPRPVYLLFNYSLTEGIFGHPKVLEIKL
ncbi:B12-binding domain-containing radical SAM protein [Anaerobranca gottschalkii]|uniref:Radical SAM superfamily enzyme YgiQ, UPF0313 family n=1 Tax=Anaerobranca gottschalkii DSM 13577 TaxID=1120990 RepID=A0A1I0BPG4_9FIRM|nr:B12-binding domain-containing radical SAM protein [Anaerobranca gottschalkii]SET08202.1 Radical SAM superfamily enzyme YgiQ, UPF0313 family [Anaerobranca gottschalkii DSM 13577]